MTCGSGKIIINNELNAIAQARTDKKEIHINKRRLSKYSSTFQHWVFLHECAHMYIYDEATADCWALRRGYYRRLFGRGSLGKICKALWAFPATNSHFSGPDRCIHMKSCMARLTGNRVRRSKSIQK